MDHHTLAAAPAAAPSGAALGGTMLIVVVFVAITIYCVKHKGWDMPQILMGYCLAIVISGVSWGSSLNGAFSNGISTVMSTLVHAISNAS